MKRSLLLVMLMGCIVSAFAQATITVEASSEIMVEPDKVIIVFGIETINKNITLAKNENAAIYEKACSVLKELGIKDSDIQTDYMGIRPEYKDGEDSPDGRRWYHVENMFSVSLYETAKFDELVSGVLAAGVNILRNISFESTKLRYYKDEARENALKAAREKAKKMAAVYGGSIGKPKSIVDKANHRAWYGAAMQNSVQNYGGDASDGGGTIGLGKISISAEVSVVFELK